MDRKVSLKDVANKVGVSTALVSYVLNGKEKEARVGKDMAVRIRKVAKAMNYRPNFMAKGLKSGKSNTIGLIVADISNPFFSGLARIVEDRAKQLGYTVIFGSNDEQAEKSSDLLETLVDRQVDGMIIAPADNTAAQLATVARSIPLVLIDRYFPDSELPAVYTDNFHASRMAVCHLLDNGFRKIGIVLYKNKLVHTVERKRGYRQALKDHQISADRNLIAEIRFDNMEEEIAGQVERLVKKEKADAIFFSTNSLAIHGLRQLTRLGKRVPDDIAIVGFDEADAFEFFYSTITYVRQDMKAIGQRAVDELISQIDDKKTNSNKIEIPATLVIGESSGFPRKRR